MLRFLAGRLFSSFLSIIGATLAVFTLTNFHNDPRLLFVPDSGNGITQEQWDKLGERLGMNKPFHERYIDWIGRTLRGDLGISLARQMAVTDIVMAKDDFSLTDQEIKEKVMAMEDADYDSVGVQGEEIKGVRNVIQKDNKSVASSITPACVAEAAVNELDVAASSLWRKT